MTSKEVVISNHYTKLIDSLAGCKNEAECTRIFEGALATHDLMCKALYERTNLWGREAMLARDSYAPYAKYKPIFDNCAAGKLDLVSKYYLKTDKQNPPPKTLSDLFLRTPLMFAAENKHAVVIKYLLEKYTADTPDISGHNALSRACDNKDSISAKLLFDACPFQNTETIRASILRFACCDQEIAKIVGKLLTKQRNSDASELAKMTIDKKDSTQSIKLSAKMSELGHPSLVERFSRTFDEENLSLIGKVTAEILLDDKKMEALGRDFCKFVKKAHPQPLSSAVAAKLTAHCVATKESITLQTTIKEMWQHLAQFSEFLSTDKQGQYHFAAKILRSLHGSESSQPVLTSSTNVSNAAQAVSEEKDQGTSYTIAKNGAKVLPPLEESLEESKENKTPS